MAKNESQFTNFKIHSQFSICEGAVKIDELAQYCKKNKVKAIGLCDSNNLCGALEFAEKISKVGTQPLIGTQINFKKNNFIGKLPVFAKSEKGYRNLTKLSSSSYLEIDGMTEPNCSLDQLIKFLKVYLILLRMIFIQKFKDMKKREKKILRIFY